MRVYLVRHGDANPKEVDPHRGLSAKGLRDVQKMAAFLKPLGIQVGAMVTKVVKGITIRGFYALAVLAGFVNRAFALPGKLVELEVLRLPRTLVEVLDAIGVWSFFLVISIFAVWVIGTFISNIGTLKEEGRSHAR